MSWRRGELWLETDLFWFRETAAAAAVPAFAPVPIPPGSAARARRLAAEA